MRRSITVLIAALLFATNPTCAENLTQREALAELQNYIGDWSGVGQLRRGSTKGAWIESSGWAWKFGDDSASIVFQIKNAKYYPAGELQTAMGKMYELTALTNDRTEVKYSGRMDDRGSLVLTAKDAPKDKPARISIRQVASGKRMIILYEKQVGTE